MLNSLRKEVAVTMDKGGKLLAEEDTRCLLVVHIQQVMKKYVRGHKKKS